MKGKQDAMILAVSHHPILYIPSLLNQTTFDANRASHIPFVINESSHGSNHIICKHVRNITKHLTQPIS